MQSTITSLIPHEFIDDCLGRGKAGRRKTAGRGAARRRQAGRQAKGPTGPSSAAGAASLAD